MAFDLIPSTTDPNKQGKWVQNWTELSSSMIFVIKKDAYHSYIYLGGIRSTTVLKNQGLTILKLNTGTLIGIIKSTPVTLVAHGY